MQAGLLGFAANNLPGDVTRDDEDEAHRAEADPSRADACDERRPNRPSEMDGSRASHRAERGEPRAHHEDVPPGYGFAGLDLLTDAQDLPWEDSECG